MLVAARHIGGSLISVGLRVQMIRNFGMATWILATFCHRCLHQRHHKLLFDGGNFLFVFVCLLHRNQNDLENFIIRITDKHLLEVCYCPGQIVYFAPRIIFQHRAFIPFGLTNRSTVPLNARHVCHCGRMAFSVFGCRLSINRHFVCNTHM